MVEQLKKGVTSLIHLAYILIKNVPAHYESTHKEDNVDNYGDWQSTDH